MRTIPFGRPIIKEEEKKRFRSIKRQCPYGPRAENLRVQILPAADTLFRFSSCTAALHLSYFYRGLKPKEEVIVPAQTHVATAHAVEFCGAKPVFIDAEERTGNIDINQIEKNINRRTRAISIVHFLGMPVDMQRINKIAAKHNLFVVEDCALAVGTYFKGRHAGLHGDVGCFSFYPVKHFTTCEGGMLLTKHKKIARKILRQKAFGVDRHVGERKTPGIYDVNMLGFNYRMNELQAALGIEQLKRVNGFLKIRKENYELLSNGLKDMDELSLLKSSGGDYQSSYYCLSVILRNSISKNVLRLSVILKSGV